MTSAKNSPVSVRLRTRNEKAYGTYGCSRLQSKLGETYVCAAKLASIGSMETKKTTRIVYYVGGGGGDESQDARLKSKCAYKFLLEPNTTLRITATPFQEACIATVRSHWLSDVSTEATRVVASPLARTTHLCSLKLPTAKAPPNLKSRISF